MKIDLEILYWEWRLKWAKIKKWFYEREPIFCSIHEGLILRKNAVYEMTLTGLSLPLCRKCHAKWFPKPEHPNCRCVSIPMDDKE